MSQRGALRDLGDTLRFTDTGLGLSVVKAVIERHGGTIQVARELGKGTTFTMDLPRTTPTAG